MAYPAHHIQSARQRGAALIITLTLLTITTLLTLSTYQSSLSQERMAGNHRESFLALNEAEAGVSTFLKLLRNPETPDSPLQFDGENGGDALKALIGAVSNATGQLDGAEEDFDTVLASANDALAEATANWQPGSLNGGVGSYRWELGAFHSSQSGSPGSVSGDTFWLISEGRYGQPGREAMRRIRALFTIPESLSFPFSGIMSCEGVTLKGSGTIDSYNSTQGAYGANGNSLRNQVIVGSQVESKPITLSGNAPIYGQVQVPGDLLSNGSSPIIGDITANGSVQITGGNWWYAEQQKSGRVFGNIRARGDISVTGTVHGDIEANGNIDLDWGSRIEGNATGETVDIPTNGNPDDFVTGHRRAVAGGAGVSPLPSVATAAECDHLGVDEHVESFAHVASSGSLSLKGSGRDILLSSSGLHDPNGGPEVTVVDETLYGREVSVARFDSFSLGGSARFVIGEPDRPVDMVMVIDGNTDIGGGGSFTISQGSTLQIVTSGQFDLGSGITTGDEKPTKQVDGETVPILTVVSNYRDADMPGQGHSGVKVGGASAFFGQVIAPFSRVDIHGSGGMFGAVNGRTVEVSGGGGFHYDESFEEMPNRGSENNGSQPRIIGINEAYK